MKIVMVKPRWKNDDWQWKIWSFIYHTLTQKLDQRQHQVFTDNWKKESPQHFDVVLKHHIRNPQGNELDYKLSYFSDLWYFKNGGYSGYSDIVHRNDMLVPKLNQDPDEFYKERVKSIITTTKFDQQKNIEPELPDSFILVPLQVESDTVMKLKKIETSSIIDYAIRVARLLKTSVVIKPHPKENGKTDALHHAAQLHSQKRLFISYGNIQKLLDKSTAVFVVNSGVGFEALCRHKPVFTFGKTDYHHVTHHNYRDVRKMAQAIENHDNSYYNVFLQNFWNELIDFRFEKEAEEKIIHRVLSWQ